MKHISSKIAAFVALFAFALAAFAQTYPITNPTYIPNLRMPQFAIASGVAGTPVLLNGIGTVGLQITGTCTSLAGTLEGSNNSTWVTLNVYPHNATVAASAAASITGTGMYIANVSGINKIRFNNTAVSGTACAGNLGGSPNAFTLPR